MTYIDCRERPEFSEIVSGWELLEAECENEIREDDLQAVTATAPKGIVTIVFTDISGATALWEWNAEVMKAALRIHCNIVRNCIRTFHGFEVKNEGDAFMIAFSSPYDALKFCTTSQLELLRADWDPLLLGHPVATVIVNGFLYILWK